MSNTGKLKAQQLQELLARALNGDLIDIDENKPLPISFPYKYFLTEPQHGKQKVLWIKKDQVVEYVADKAVENCVIKATQALSADYESYRVTASQAKAVSNYWFGLTKIFDHNQIKPVLQKSTPGYTFQRLDFDIAEQPTPLFDDFLGHVETNRNALLSYIGMLFDETAPRQFYLWLYGQGNDGKGTLARFIKKIFGDAYVACQEPARKKGLSEDKFFTSRLVGKRIGIFGDVTNRDLVSDSLFLQLTGGDAVSVEYKGKDAVTMDLNVLFLFLSNHLPNISGSKAHMRRAVICSMKERPDDFTPTADYESHLWEERAGILYKCVTAWASMKSKYGRFVFDTEVSEALAEDNELQWETLFENNLELHKDGQLLPHDLQQRFVDLRMNQYTLSQFKNWLERRKQIKVFRPSPGAKRYFPGVQLKPLVPHRHLAVVNNGDHTTLF